jgi:hypothetical protein
MNHILTSVLDIVRPAQQVVANLPIKHTKTPIEQLHELIKMNPSKRTYYLGKCGRVSQRKQLVGEVIATVRAFTTDHARYLFSDYETMRTYHVSVPKPFIGEAVLCKCGWHHAKKAECPVCANWKHIGQQIVAGEAEA